MRNGTAYREDLAYVHHTAFGGLPTAAARWLIRYLTSHRVPPGTILDLGCGSGILAAHLTGGGWTVHGIDRSRSMIELARRTAPGASFRVGSMYSSPWPPATAIVAVGEGLNCAAPRGGPPDFSSWCRRAARALPARGLLVFDMITGPREHLAPSVGFAAGPDWSVGVRTVLGPGPRALTRRITVFRRVDGSYRRSDETHVAFVRSRPWVVRQMRRHGFGVRVADGYSQESTLPGRTVFIARKQ